MRAAWAVVALVPLAGCGAFTRLSEAGGPPKMTPSANPTQAPGYRPISMPLPPTALAAATPASLWRPGARAFLKDQRASEVGDLLTVVVNVTDTAALQDTTTITRNSNESLGVPNILGLAALFPHIFGKASSTQSSSASTTNTGSTDNTAGNGQVTRNESVQLRLAAVVTQVLRNGNLVIAARQEMRVNNELRVLLVTGVVRPEDIASDNTITHDRIAEARISYGGRGDLTYAQHAPWGQQVLDTIAPF